MEYAERDEEDGKDIDRVMQMAEDYRRSADQGTGQK